MVGATRSRALNATVEEPTSPGDDGTLADAPLDQSSNFAGRSTTFTTPQGSKNSYVRDDASRLSEGLEPMHLGDGDSKYSYKTH
jgi:hypothetical protein